MMGGIFETRQQVDDHYAGQGPRIDVSDLCCPRCGFPDCEIITTPDPKKWFTRIGKAECRHCQVRFNILAIDDE